MIFEQGTLLRTCTFPNPYPCRWFLSRLALHGQDGLNLPCIFGAFPKAAGAREQRHALLLRLRLAAGLPAGEHTRGPLPVIWKAAVPFGCVFELDSEDFRDTFSCPPQPHTPVSYDN